MAQKIISIIFLFSTVIQGLPRFAVQEGASCNLCHVDPNGGGLRNDYGMSVTSSELSSSNKTSSFTGMISDHLQLGGDIRVMNYNVEKDDDFTSAIFPMQMDLSSHWRVNDELGLFIKQDVLRGNNDAWILWSGLPFNGYIKAGKDLPAFGMNVDDHTSFTRGGNIRKKALQFEGLAFTPYLSSPGIVEVGFSKGNVHFSQSIANQFLDGSASSGFGENISDKVFTTRFEWWPSLENINGFIGASMMDEGPIKYKGIFGGINFNKLTWTGEVDIAEEYASTGTVLASSSEFSYRLKQGLDLLIKFDLFDEDIDTTGSAIQRFTVGSEYFPLPFLEVRCQARFTEVIGSDAELKPEYLLLIHTWF